MVRRGENLLFLSNCSCARAKVTSLIKAGTEISIHS
jgi:hypothetical protein